MNVTAHGRQHFLIRVMGILSLSTLTTAACVSTENGTTYSGSNLNRVITISGYHTAADVEMEIEVLNSPASNPNDNGNWIPLGTTITDSTVSFVWDNTTDLYEWSIDVTPVDALWKSGRWPESGLVKVRAKVAGTIIKISTLDDTECMVEQHSLHTPFLDAVGICQSHDPYVLTLVDIDDAAGKVPNPTVDFLSRKKTLLAQATEYYKAVGALTNAGAPTAARGTFNAWKTTNGFPTGEIVATYYNRGDLGFGRDMHCRTTGYGKACYVTNYGTVEDGLDDLQDGTALADAVTHTNPGATVAMEWHQAAAANQNPVRFFVYSPGGGLLTEIALDSNPAPQPVPGLCLACHGGTMIDPADALPRVEGAQFLPFDLDSFAYHASLSKNTQLNAFASLNQLVKATLPAGAAGDPSRELINGWHAVVGSFKGDFIPAGFQGTKESEAFYKYVYRPYCQVCHTAQAGAPKTFAQFDAFGNYIASVTCGAPNAISMPHAEVTFESFWKSSARAHLTGTLGILDACDGK